MLLSRPRLLQHGLQICALCTTILLCGGIQSVAAGTITINAAFDAYYEDRFGGIFDTAEFLTVADDPDDERRTALEFLLPDEIIGATINSAFLQLDFRGASWSAGAPGVSHTYDYFNYIGDGAILIGDFTPSGSAVGTTVHDFTGGTADTSNINLDVTSSLQGHVLNLDEYAGFLITSPLVASGDGLSRSFESSESGSGFAPRLVIGFTAHSPEPSGAGILAMLMLLRLGGRRRRA